MGRFEEIELSAKARQRPAINVATDYKKGFKSMFCLLIEVFHFAHFGFDEMSLSYLKHHISTLFLIIVGFYLQSSN